MIYNIRIEFKDGTVEKFQTKSNIKPTNSFKLHDQIANQIFPREWKEITSKPVYWLWVILKNSITSAPHLITC